jgi:hypothetical protein
MTRREAIQEACSIMALAYHSIGEYTDASDGFCFKCATTHRGWNYTNAGGALRYVRRAVLVQLKRDGYKVAPQCKEGGE